MTKQQKEKFESFKNMIKADQKTRLDEMTEYKAAYECNSDLFDTDDAEFYSACQEHYVK